MTPSNRRGPALPQTTDTQPLMSEAIAVAHAAAREAMRYFRGHLGVEFKADESPVTQADRAVETLVRDLLVAQYPDHGILGEEHGSQGSGRRQIWVVDPIDGTRSFLSGHPLFGFLLGHLTDGHPDLGLIGMPALNEVFVGAKGQGATLNDAPITTSTQTSLEQAILFINEGEKLFASHPDIFARLMRAGQTRRLGYDCYPHALVAAGLVDAVVDFDLQPYDYLPVCALIEAAGGMMTDWQGQPLGLHSDGRTLTAATPQLHGALLELVNG